jgi:Family of unknown function (DUF5995)
VTASDAATALRAIARSQPDALGYFPALYARVTDRVAAGISERRFEDGPRMDAFITEFADHYLQAFRERATRARCWQACWDVVHPDALLIVQHLLLGINAHVNYDLPQTVAGIARRDGDWSAVRRDFDAVNSILAATAVDVLRDLDRVSRWTNEVASLGGGRLFNFSLRAARDQAWFAAQRLAGMDAEQESGYLRELDDLVAVLAYLISRPLVPGASLIVRLARHLENRRPTEVTAALLGDR